MAKPKAGAYFPSWSTVPPSQLDFSKFDILYYAFATPSASNGVNFDDASVSTLQSLVSEAHKSGTKVVLSIGGWGGCQYYSRVMNPSNQAQFVAAVVDAVKTYDLDGIDIDWEYPNQPGAGQPYSPDDAANLLSFFTALRSNLGTAAIISAAVTDQPFTGPDGQPLTDVSAYAKVMTYVNLMNYDVFGASASPGPNAPLGDLCGTSSHPESSAQAALKQWTAAGFPPGQLMLGLPLYGYVSQSTKTSLQDRDTSAVDRKLQQPLDAYREHVLSLAGKQYAVSDTLHDLGKQRGSSSYDANDDGQAFFANGMRSGQLDPAANETEEYARGSDPGDLGAFAGQQIAFSDLIANGALAEEGGNFTAINGYQYQWDKCSDTPFIYDTSRSTVVTFDDPASLGIKAKFALTSGMAGAFTWSLDQDYNYVLQNAIMAGLGL